MKRSEAIKCIIDILFYGKLAESARLGARKDFITNLAGEDAEAVLKELEALGMIPPETKALPSDFINTGLSQEFLDEHEFKVNRWEPEDE